MCLEQWFSDVTETLLDAVLMFVRYCEQNEEFDLLTHGMGPGLVSVVMHNFSDFLGDVMGQKLDHNTRYRGKRLYPQMYMEKMRKIVNSIVVDKTDEYMGKMLKGQEEKQDKAVPKKIKNPRPTKKKQQDKAEPDEASSSDDIELLSDGSCSENENDFSTLTSSWGTAYHPPSKQTSKSRFAKKDNDDEDIVQCIEDMRTRLDRQKHQIDKLTSENEAVKEKLRKWHSRNVAPPVVGKGGNGKQASASLKQFVGSQCAEITTVDSSEDEKMEKHPDSTNRDGTGSDVGSGIFQSSQMLPPYWCRLRIDSDTQSVKHGGNTPNSENDSETEVDRLLKTKSELEMKFQDMQRKLTDQKMESKVRAFQDQIIVTIRDFRSKLMDYYGASRTDERVVKARETFAEEVKAISQFGYTFRVGESFVDRVEKSILSGQTPEQQYICTKTDNLEDDPVQGHVVDIIYEVCMPVIVKKEVHNDDDDDKDCKILSVQLAPLGLLKNIKVKVEKIEDDMPKKADTTDVPKQANTEKKTSREHETGTGGQADEDMPDEEEEEGTPKKGNKRGRKKATDTKLKRRNLRSSSKRNEQDQEN